MKIYRLAFICILILLLVMEPILTINVIAKENDGSRTLDVGSKIEQYVDEHADTTAGMSVAVFDENDTIYRNCLCIQ